MKDHIAFRGNRKKWTQFVNELRFEGKKVWDVMSAWIDDYLRGRK